MPRAIPDEGYTPLFRAAKALVAPVLRVLFRMRIRHSERIPATGPAIIAANHFSYLDTVLLPAIVPRQIHFLAKEELFATPLMEKMFTGFGQIPITRGSGDESALEASRDLLLEKRRLLGIFPEGTNTRDGKLLSAHTGVARIGIDTGVPVIPVGIIGSYEALPRGALLPTLCRVVVKVGRPISLKQCEQYDTAAETYRAATYRIMAEIAHLIGEEDGRYKAGDEARRARFIYRSPQ